VSENELKYISRSPLEYLSASFGKDVNTSDTNSVLDILMKNSDNLKYRQLSHDLLNEGLAFSNMKTFDLQKELAQKLTDCEKMIGDLRVIPYNCPFNYKHVVQSLKKTNACFSTKC